MRYRLFDSSVVPVGKGMYAMHSWRSGVSALISSADLHLLSECTTFESLSDHAASFSLSSRRRKLGRLTQESQGFKKAFSRWLLKSARAQEGPSFLNSDAREEIEHRLASFARAGFLVSEEAIREDIFAATVPAAREPGPIGVLGIPTRERPLELARALSSFAENFQAHERCVECLVVDDSVTPNARHRNRKMLEQFSQSAPYNNHYVDRPSRTRFASTLARLSGVAQETIRFAILGRDSGFETYGAARNTLLLLCAGKSHLQTDDDTLVYPPSMQSYENALELHSGLDPFEYRFERGQADQDVVSKTGGIDILGAHERLLGRSVVDCVKRARLDAQSINVDAISPLLLKHLRTQLPVVTCTLMGSTGDSGMHEYQNTSRLLSVGITHDHLVADATRYRERLNTREVIRGVPQYTISDTGPVMSMQMAVDGDSSLPPFLPVCRGEDAVFGSILRHLSDCLIGYVPYMVAHRPAETRSHACIIRDNEMAVEPVTCAGLIKWLVTDYACTSVSSDDRMREIGEFLSAIASQADSDLEQNIHVVWHKYISRRIRMADQLLNEFDQSPGVWARDVESYIECLRSNALVPHRSIPVDIPGTASDRLHTLRSILRDYGKLLVHWPALLDAASKISVKSAVGV